MRKLVRSLWLVAIFSFAACEPGSEQPGSEPAAVSDHLAALRTRSDLPLAAGFDPTTSRLVTLRGRIAPSDPDSIDSIDSMIAARAFLEENAALLGIDPDLHELRFVRRAEGATGESLVFDALYRGVRVFDGGVLVGFDASGRIIHLASAIEPIADLATVPKISATEAIAALQPMFEGWSAREDAVELVIVRGDKEYPGDHLAWLVPVETTSPAGAWWVFVSALDGSIVRAIDRVLRSGPPCVPCDPNTNLSCGFLFPVNPVDLLGTGIRDADNVDAAMSGCVLDNLTSTTNLTGTYVNTSITAAPRAAPPYNALRSVNQNFVDEVNAYYHLNRAKEYLNALGFPTVMNFSINTDGHDPTLGDNAHYVPSTHIIEYGVGGVDDAQDLDVVCHEYGHAIQDNQVPGYGTNDEGGAAGEGFGDYWASALSDDTSNATLGLACVGAWDATAYNPYTGVAGTGCLRHVDGTKLFPRDMDFEVHDDGEMWSAALWRLRGAIGGAAADPLVIQSHTYLLASARFINLADALHSADVALYGGLHSGDIEAAMIAGGIPRSATPASSTGLSQTAAFTCGSVHNYANNEYDVCTFTQPGATRLRFHFTRFDTESGFDFAYVSDPSFRTVQVMSGALFPTGGSSAAVTGDTIVLRFKADFTVRRFGFQIDRVDYALCTADADCDDHNACNGAETCTAGACAAGTPLVTDDGNACTSDSCDPVIGAVHAPVANGTSCADGTVCNGAETCSSGTCTVGTPINPDDGNACTSDSCDPVTGAVHAPVANGTSCADGTVCNGAETCSSGTCTAGTPINSDDGNACTTDSCDPVLGAVHAPVANGTSCADGTVCNGAETCSSGTCTAGTPINSDDGNACTTDSCDAVLGAVHAPVANGTSCADGTVCNGAETCVSGTCSSGTPVNPDDGNPCTSDSCDPAVGAVHVALPAGSACSDGDGTNGVEQCDDTASCVGYDIGDAPDPTYPTLAANNGPRHLISSLYLGTVVDGDADAVADDADDGVAFAGALTPNTTATVLVTASLAGRLDAWIDFDGDGSWDDLGDQIFADRALSAGVNTLAFSVPASANAGATYARFRVSSAGNLAFTGDADDGEVEDYAVNIAAAGTSISISDASIAEGDSGLPNLVFTVSLSQPSSNTVTVVAATANGTATASDFVPISTTITFPPGTVSRTMTVRVRGDTLFEPDETFAVNLSSAQFATIADAQGVGTIVNDDAAPQISINDVAVTEGNTGTSNAVFTLSVSRPSSQAVTVRYGTVADTAAAGDYTNVSGTLTFPANSTSITVAIAVRGDTMYEPTETFFVDLSTPVGAVIADARGVGTILNDDPIPTVSINDVTMSEGNANGTATFTLTLSNASSQSITVVYTTRNGTALSPSDYTARGASVVFAAASLTRTVSITTRGDVLVEPDETFFVDLTSATNASLGDATGACTLINDD